MVQVWFQNHRARARRRKRNNADRRESRHSTAPKPVTNGPAQFKAGRRTSPTLYERRHQAIQAHKQQETRRPQHNTSEVRPPVSSQHKSTLPPLMPTASIAKAQAESDEIDIVSTPAPFSLAATSSTHQVSTAAATAEPSMVASQQPQALPATYYSPQQQLYVAVQAPAGVSPGQAPVSSASPRSVQQGSTSVPMTYISYGASPTQFAMEWPPTPQSAPLNQNPVVIPQQVQYQVVPSPWLRLYPGQQNGQHDAGVQQ